jgi:hypothetical protein
MAKVDVVVPCYNYGRFLEACVGSVLEQSIRDLRVLIIDDASTDDSASIAKKLAEADPRVTVIAHARNKGHIGTYNEGIAWASADYFLLLSADDLLVPGALERAVEIMDVNPDIVLTYGECVTWHDHLPVPDIEPMQSHTWKRHDLLNEMCMSATNVVPTPTAIARTSTQKAIGGYRASLPHSGDMEMWLRFAANGAVARIDAVQAIYRKHSTAMSNPYLAERLSDYQQRKQAFDCVFESYSERIPKLRSLRKKTYHSLADQSFQSGVGHVRQGRISGGLALLRWAMKLDRRSRYFPPLWQFFRLPGPERRHWAVSLIRTKARDVLGWSSRPSNTLQPKREGNSEG